MTLVEKRMRAVDIQPASEPLKPGDAIILENVGGLFQLRRANVDIETPHAILNSDCTYSEDGTELHVPSWWFTALVKRYNAEHAHG